jgi:hypothetical protein
VADIASYTEAKASKIDLVEQWIPLMLAIFGVVTLIAAVVMRVATRTRARVAA